MWGIAHRQATICLQKSVSLPSFRLPPVLALSLSTLTSPLFPFRPERLIYKCNSTGPGLEFSVNCELSSQQVRAETMQTFYGAFWAKTNHAFGDIKSTINRLFVSQLQFTNICKTSKSFVGIYVFKSCGALPYYTYTSLGQFCGVIHFV